MNRLILYSLIFLLSICKVNAQQSFVYSDNSKQSEYIGKSTWVLKDETNKVNIKEAILSNNFTKNDADITSYGLTGSTIWIKFSVFNNSKEDKLILGLNSPSLDQAELFSMNNDSSYTSQYMGQDKEFSTRKYKHTTYFFDMNIEKGKERTFFLRVRSFDKVELPMYITTPVLAFESATNHNFFFGIYIGVMLIMLLYNLFIYFSIRDKSYLYYVFYIFSVMICQASFQGYTFRYLWPTSPGFEAQSIQIMSVLVGFASVQFLRVFLQTALYLPKLDKVFLSAYVLYSIAAIMVFLGFYFVSWILILCIVSPLSLLMLYAGFKIASMGYRPAKYFCIAWSFFLFGVFIFAMKDFTILPFNKFTVYTMPVGSAIETILLSLALADKINILKMEKERSQSETLRVLQENEQIIKQQNILLEEKVKERTAELEASHTNLKDAQSQLVNSEKMASLGQLTAGIAHEINNPINSVYANVKPLKRDLTYVISLLEKYYQVTGPEGMEDKLLEIEKYKVKHDINYVLKEIETLLKGIDEGSARTIEIVKSLRKFARLDEPGVKKTNIIDGLNSTLLLLNNAINKAGAKIVTKYENEVLDIDCFGGQINQVFMNVLNNALQAMEGNKIPGAQKILTISTSVKGERAIVSIADTGPGIPEKIRHKIFEPFFTTKSVGEGTGLGLSISFNIIKSHNGEITVTSQENKGTEFIISLPLTQVV